MYGINPFALPSSSQATWVKVPLQAVAVNRAMPPSRMTPVLESRMSTPLAGTTTENQTSLPV